MAARKRGRPRNKVQTVRLHLHLRRDAAIMLTDFALRHDMSLSKAASVMIRASVAAKVPI